MSYTKTEGTFPSADKVHGIHYYICKPDGVNPRGIIQIVHGMSECASRYEEEGTVEALAAGGYIVCAADHLGHGRSVDSPEEYGDVADMDHLLEDIRSLRALLRAKYRYLPYFMLGHSMGSFLLRDYLHRHPDELDGVILSGTTGGDDPISAGKLLASLFSVFGMGKKRAPLFQKIMYASCNSKLKDKDGDFLAWIVSDPAILAERRKREDYGFPFTYRGYAQLFGLMKKITDEEYISNTPRSVPILLVSGEEDPVGGMGDGIRFLRDRLSDAGVDDLEMKLYPNARHEILNEPCKETVLADILAWADAECEHIRRSKIWNPLG